MIAIATVTEIGTEIVTVVEIATETGNDVEAGRRLTDREETTTTPTHPAEIIVHAREKSVTTEDVKIETGIEIVVHGEETITDATIAENETCLTIAEEEEEEGLAENGKMTEAQEKTEMNSQLKHEVQRQTALLLRSASPPPI